MEEQTPAFLAFPFRMSMMSLFRYATLRRRVRREKYRQRSSCIEVGVPVSMMAGWPKNWPSPNPERKHNHFTFVYCFWRAFAAIDGQLFSEWGTNFAAYVGSRAESLECPTGCDLRPRQRWR